MLRSTVVLLALACCQMLCSVSSFLLANRAETRAQFRTRMADNESELQASDSLASLKAEAASPFKLLRQFVYGAMAAGGGLGTFTAIPQLIFAFTDEGGDKVNAVKNIVIDAGAVVAAGVLWKIEADNAKAKLERFKGKERISGNLMASTDASDREQALAMLPVEIQTSQKDENATKIVSLGDLQARGKQHVIIVTGNAKFVKDAVMSARLEGADMFSDKNTMVIPFISTVEESQLDEKLGKGFGNSKAALMEAPYIAKPKQVRVYFSLVL
jgi:hypothetical protein